MLSKSKVQAATKAIISFANSYKYNKKRKQNDKSQSTPSITAIAASLQSLSIQIRNNQTCKSVTQVRNLLESLIELTRFRLCTHMTKEEDRLRVGIRSNSRKCLDWIQYFGDAQVQSDLVNVEYGKVMTISISTSGGKGEELDKEIYNGLRYITFFLSSLHEGRKDQIESEGGSEEIDAQLINDGDYGNIKSKANDAKVEILNRFKHSINQRQL
ncbi:MAG: hypothetical protein EZS28_009869 [Streblomastix strix]|uniref:Uncharacterized protein n=1 Tax=Streblomastix strix TaxID=222440 RepID=A0A5J4WIQ2_9EUKA|nr:MAG: hypothetical protein EZS28_009869 [Streblomastix strix]